MQLSLPAVFATLCLVVTPVFAQDGLSDNSSVQGKGAPGLQSLQKEDISHAKKSISHGLHAVKAKAHKHADQNVRDAQMYLSKLGYKVGAADGVLGKKTKSALMDYEKKNKLPVTSKVSPDLMKSLVKSSQKSAAKDNVQRKS